MARTEPIVMARFEQGDAHTLAGYERSGGYAALRKALSMETAAIQAEVEASGLTGRSGGAGFPAARKWSLLAPGKPSYVVVNGDESEPGFGKDRVLMEVDPHQLIEGSLICAHATGSAQVFLYVRGEMALAQERLAQALTDAYAAGYVGRDIMGTGVDIDVVLHWGAGAYIVGEETALIESLEGQRGMPRLKPPYFPAVKGVYMQPTIVYIVETLSNLPWILLNGGAAFAAMGTNRSLGMRMFTLSGHVNRPGNYEIELASMTFRELFENPLYGAGMRDGNALKAFLVGASFPWFFEDQLDVSLDIDEVQKAGSMLGSGIVVMDDTTCAVRAAHNLVRFFAHESCGKCTPCREGTSWLEKILHRIETGSGRDDDLELLLDVSDNISPGIAWPPKQTTICPLGPSAVAPIASSIHRFRDEYLLHIKEGGCPRGRH
ncbi:MAG: NADH-quinone oxidoreductase subunit [Actinomycetota bacterium]|nr:NADH-quinone oxidoreductase subunit [Actinomycetota bacterium]